MPSMPISNNDASNTILLKAQIIGRNKDEILEGFTQCLSPQEEPRVYRTWFNIRMLSRLANLFEDGVESAGGLFELICVFLVAFVIIGFVILSQLVIFSIVIVFIAIFSGGASLKFFRTTYIEIPTTSVNPNGTEKFVIDQLNHGSLVSIDSDNAVFTSSAITQKANRATKAYLFGINTCQFTAMVFVLAEIVHFILFHTWLVDKIILAFFGLFFLAGIIILDAGVLMRRGLVTTLTTQQ